MADTLTSAGALLKSTFSDAMESVAYRKESRPFLTMVKKNKRDGGSSFEHTIQYGDSVGVSADEATALANASNVKYLRLSLTQARKFKVGEVQLQLLEDAKAKGPGAFADALKETMESAIENFANDVETEIFQLGGGAVGQVAATSGLSTTLTLADPLSYVNFNVGDQIQLATTEAGTTVRDAGDYVTVTAVNGGVVSSSLTLDAALTNIAAAATGDFIVKRGNATLSLKGLPAWNPYVAPAAGDAVLGASADRSVDVNKLAGSRLDGSGMRLDEALSQMAMIVGLNGGSSDTCFINPVQFYNLTQSQAGKVVLTDSGDMKIGGKMVTILGGPVPIKVVPAPKCPSNVARFVRMADWELRSSPMGFGELVPYGGQTLFPAYNSFNAQFRIAGFGILWCRRPNDNGVVLLPPA